MVKKKIIAIVQARLGSERFPDKVLQKLKSENVLSFLIKRLEKSKYINKVIVAIPKNKRNITLLNFLIKTKKNYFLGSEKDVLDRFYKASLNESPDYIVRITGDCPFVDPEIVDECIKKILDENYDYVSNINPPTFPDGFDVEVFSFSALKITWKLASKKEDKEHVTKFMREHSEFNSLNIENNEDLSDLRMTLDYEEDLEVIKNIYNNFYPNLFFSFNEIIKFYKKNKKVFKKNMRFKRNTREVKNSGQILLKKAESLIPGSNMLLSKRSDMFLPGMWPAYYKKAKGCFVWDLDNKKYIDMSLMGVGTNILGYSHPEVNKAVSENIKKSNMSTLNCPEEVYLAENLIEMHPWAEMVKFARTGGEANSIAVRIARAASKKDKIAVCGYHGWHDWYLSANLTNQENLSEHLLPGLKVKGVPNELKNTVFPFKYNDFKSLKNIIEKHDIGVIKMEVQRSIKPEGMFLEKVRELATKKNIVLIFDECTSGFRENYGGLHLKHKVYPDVAIFGKALGNGFAITSIIGKKEIMEAAQSTFISSTFWTERAGPTAALKTLEIMKDIKSWEIITKQGKKIEKGWDRISKQNNIIIEKSGLSSLANFSFVSKNSRKYKSFLTSEMLKKGFLASNAIYTCIDHTDKLIESYFDNLEEVFYKISEFEKGNNIDELNSLPIASEGFERLN